MNGKGLFSLGFLYLSRMMHAQLSKATNSIEIMQNWLCCLVSGYGEKFFSAGVLLWGLTF